MNNNKLELSSLLVEKIKSMIFSGELTGGEQIRQEEFSKRLGVSRTPLLHALQILKSEMLVESIPNRGIFVRKISLSELRDIFQFREVIESMSCRLACDRISKSEIKELRELFEPFVKNPNTSLKKYQIADKLFHEKIIEFSGNTIFPRMTNMGNVLLTAYQKGLIRPVTETLPEHIRIIDLLEAGEKVKAEREMRKHLRLSVKLIENEIKELKKENHNK